jgi:hypothetical protein
MKKGTGTTPATNYLAKAFVESGPTFLEKNKIFGIVKGPADQRAVLNPC